MFLRWSLWQLWQSFQAADKPFPITPARQSSLDCTHATGFQFQASATECPWLLSMLAIAHRCFLPVLYPQFPFGSQVRNAAHLRPESMKMSESLWRRTLARARSFQCALSSRTGSWASLVPRLLGLAAAAFGSLPPAGPSASYNTIICTECVARGVPGHQTQRSWYTPERV